MISEVIGPITGLFDRAVGTTAKVRGGCMQGYRCSQMSCLCVEVDGRGGPLLRVWCLDVSCFANANVWLGCWS